MQSSTQEAVSLLRSIIQVQTFSGEEGPTADLIANYLEDKGIATTRLHNNIIARNQQWDDSKPTIILNSHHDTVKINNGWTRDPFGAEIDGDNLYGRGSNDAGGPLVCLISCFIQCHTPVRLTAMLRWYSASSMSARGAGL